MKLAFAIALAACASHPAPPPALSSSSPPPAAADARGAFFTLDQLRAGMAKGRVVEMRIELDGVVTVERVEVTAADGETATVHQITRDDAGNVVADRTATSKWSDLHAKYPRATTTIEDDVTIEVPAGTFTTRLYTIRVGSTTRRFWFAPDLPGPPVQYTTEEAGRPFFRARMQRAR